jgi:hypothetical protein
MGNLKSASIFNKNAPILVQSSSTAIIHVPVETIDIPSWLFALTDEEYQQCSAAHVAGATTQAPDGKRISINVELVGPGLMVQHWTEEISEKQHSHLVSISDMFVQGERAAVQLTWDMTVRSLSESSCEFTDTITLFETPDYLAFVEKSGVPAAQMKEGVRQAIDAHNADETPNFAKNIEKKALSTDLG